MSICKQGKESKEGSNKPNDKGNISHVTVINSQTMHKGKMVQFKATAMFSDLYTANFTEEELIKRFNSSGKWQIERN